MIRNVNISYLRGEKKMKYKNEQQEIIEFCLKHELIHKTDYGYIVKRTFFETIDNYKL